MKHTTRSAILAASLVLGCDSKGSGSSAQPKATGPAGDMCANAIPLDLAVGKRTTVEVAFAGMAGDVAGKAPDGTAIDVGPDVFYAVDIPPNTLLQVGGVELTEHHLALYETCAAAMPAPRVRTHLWQGLVHPFGAGRRFLVVEQGPIRTDANGFEIEDQHRDKLSFTLEPIACTPAPRLADDCGAPPVIAVEQPVCGVDTLAGAASSIDRLLGVEVSYGGPDKFLVVSIPGSGWLGVGATDGGRFRGHWYVGDDCTDLQTSTPHDGAAQSMLDDYGGGGVNIVPILKGPAKVLLGFDAEGPVSPGNDFPFHVTFKPTTN